MKIEQWMTPDPHTVESSVELQSALKKMAALEIGAILVLRNGKLAGIFTERDLLVKCSQDLPHNLSKPINDFMTPDPVCVEMDDDYNSVYMKMKTYGIRHIPVMDDGKLVGIVSIRDLTHYYQNKLESEYAEARERIAELEHLSHFSEDEKIKTLVDEIKKYKELSITDHLTGLYNKRYFMARLKEETARAKRYRQRLSLVFSDVDHFKRINDNYGHYAGDLVLKQIAAILSGGMEEFHIISRLRKADIVARYGGEEFVAILPETGIEGASTAAENVRKAIEEYEFRLNGNRSHITMSFGVTELSAEANDDSDLIKQADNALYMAKELGRNRVVAYGKDRK